MCLLIETIRLYNGRFLHLNYHNERLNKSRQDIFGTSINLDLYSYLEKTDYPEKGLFKTRVEYAENFKNINFIHYIPKEISSLRIVTKNKISYSYKYANRSCFEDIVTNEREEAVIIKNGFVTDCTYANLAFFNGNKWFTPNTCLLNGTKRQFYLDQGVILSATIRSEDIKYFDKISLINSMIDLGEICISTENVKE
jgi:4-amino-4-deoxychorismate lyase